MFGCEGTLSTQETTQAPEESWQAMPEDGWMISRIATQQTKNEEKEKEKAKSKMKRLTDFRSWVCKWLDMIQVMKISFALLMNSGRIKNESYDHGD